MEGTPTSVPSGGVRRMDGCYESGLNRGRGTGHGEAREPRPSEWSMASFSPMGARTPRRAAHDRVAGRGARSRRGGPRVKSVQSARMLPGA